MSNSDFFKQLYLAAVAGGALTADTSAADIERIMQRLMTGYLDAARTVCRTNIGLRTAGARRRSASGPTAPGERADGAAPRAA